MLRARVGILAALLSASCAHAGVTELQFGPFLISVSDSWTAQVFHMVDMLAQWDEFSHRAYGRWAKTNLLLDDTDRQLLRKHAEMRRARGWGNGFEQAFLVEDSIETAAERAIAQKLLSRDESESEREILLHFASRLTTLRDQHEEDLREFRARLLVERTRLSQWFEKLIHFTQTKNTVRALVFLVANSEANSGGGEANGGRIIVEVPSPDPIAVLFHESLHVLLAPYNDDIKAAAESSGIRVNSLREGIVYALAPGLTDDLTRRDSLAEALARYYLRKTPVSDSYAESYMIAIVIRGILRASIDDGETFPSFLPKGVAKWRSFAPR